MPPPKTGQNQSLPIINTKEATKALREPAMVFFPADSRTYIPNPVATFILTTENTHSIEVLTLKTFIVGNLQPTTTTTTTTTSRATKKELEECVLDTLLSLTVDPLKTHHPQVRLG